MYGGMALGGVAHRCAMAAAVFFAMEAAFAQPADPYAASRAALIAELREQSRADAGTATRIDPAVLRILARVPRHEYVPASERRDAYENRPLGIGYGQTISQPYIVALMTTLAQPRAGQAVLEIGTGSGYQAAVLAETGAKVHTIEIVAPLATQAAQRLRRYPNVTTRTADGYYGWKEHAPFDAIVVTAAASSIPPPLVEQLKPGGRMVIPVGSSFFTQTLLLVEKDERARVRTRQILPVRFVPLTGGP
ncbi:protein-L-isoaspartate(D-aspartate) O-methyltransferase [Lysobacter sp. FW306-1B-D06B]|uniref:protein-L-isoaspartate(D-aspartate) O-methyltransferase n=1 Tax=Lysobacter sp. FW306-1B-D06B TaxID=3140250 RepID=UPI00313FFE7D